MYGRALQQTGNAAGAATAYERAFAIEPDNPRVTAGLGIVRVSQKRYEEGEQLLTKAIEGGFRNSLFYGQLAFAQLALNKNQEAIRNYEKAFEAGIPPGANTRGLAYYNMACAYARLKQADKAFEMLGKAIDEGFSNRATFETDEDLAPLRTDARFAQLLQRLPKSRSN
jgi:tetratricopeptide (TPR) repeat protein